MSSMAEGGGPDVSYVNTEIEIKITDLAGMNRVNHEHSAGIYGRA